MLSHQTNTLSPFICQHSEEEAFHFISIYSMVVSTENSHFVVNRLPLYRAEH